MSSPQPLADDAVVTMYQIGTDGLLAALTNGDQSITIGTAVMDADRDWFRWVIESACAYNSLQSDDQTSTGTRGKTYRANRSFILQVLADAIAIIDDVDEVDATDPRVVQLATLVMDVMAAPDGS